MLLKHTFKKQIMEREVKDNHSFLLTNKVGGYVWFGSKPESRYQGVFFRANNRMMKVIEEIKVGGKVEEIHNKMHSVERKKADIKENYFMAPGRNCLLYELNKANEMVVVLDIKDSYDSREWGRHYEIFKWKKCIIVKFTKKTDEKEDKSHDKEEHTCYLAIKTKDVKFKKIDDWFENSFKIDKKRGSSPHKRYVYHALKLKAKKVVFSFYDTLKKAVEEAEFVYKHSKFLKKQKKDYVEGIQGVKNNDFNLTYVNAVNALDSLVTKTENIEGVYAGLPWFFQYWGRDELISMKALMLQQEVEEVHRFLFRHLFEISPWGRIPNRTPSSHLDSADATGWLFVRIKDFIKHFSKKEKKVISNKLKKVLDLLIEEYGKDRFVKNKEKETWMDTIDREGVRVEIQALTLAMYKLMYKLTKNKFYQSLEIVLRRKAKDMLWDGKILADGVNDKTVRPNVFIAAYVYPELLSKEEWRTCFKNVLKKLWLNWGGLATIDRKNKHYVGVHSGENNKSYHNGDSWYWVNNMAAIVMNRVDPVFFEKYINQILKASRHELLWNGAIGHHAEISSASKIESQGCVAQAWSAAMFIELVKELGL